MDAAEPAALGALLRACRIRAGLTQEELAERTGEAVSARTLRRIENGHTRPYRATVDALATALALDPLAHRELLAAWRGSSGLGAARPDAELPRVSAPPLHPAP